MMCCLIIDRVSPNINVAQAAVLTEVNDWEFPEILKLGPKHCFPIIA